MPFTVEGLTKRYARARVAVDALAEVTLTIPEGTFTTITGPSGSGKSTLLLLLGGLIRPTSGRILFRGREVHAMSHAELAAYRRKDVAFVMQSFSLVPYLTAVENVMVPLSLEGVGSAEQRGRALHALEGVGLGDRAEHLPRELSAGQQQRVAIARAVVNRPAVVLADEPTGNLDPRLARDTLDLLGELSRERGMAVVMVTHSPEAAARGTQRVHLVGGRTAAAEAPEVALV